MQRFSAILFVVLLMLPLAARAQAPGKRLPLPSGEKLDEAKKTIADAYRAAYDKTTSAQTKIALAGQMLDDSKKITDDPTSKYALLVAAREIAASAGDWEASIKAIIPLAETFDVDGFALADEVRAKIEAANERPQDARAAFRLLMDLASAAISKDRFDIAVRLTSSAQRIAKSSNDIAMAKQLAEYAVDLQRTSRKFDALKDDFKTLEREPASAAANLAIGRFRALEQDLWRDAIPMFALGSDSELAMLAGQELDESANAAQRVANADGWWQLADARKADSKALRRHAVDRYLQVRASLDGLAKRRVDSRLSDAEKWHSKEATYSVSEVGSDFDRQHPPLPTLLNAVDKFHTKDDGSHFAFVITSQYGHIVIDLKKEVAVSRLEIVNRGGAQNHRASNLRVYLSRVPGTVGQQIWQAGAAQDAWNVHLEHVYVGRYLTIARDFNRPDDAYFHLRTVKVFGPD